MTGPSRLQALFAFLLAAAALLLAQPAAAGHNVWTRLGLEDREVGCLVLGSEAELYAAAGYDGSVEGVWKSSDGGETWQSASSGLPWPAVSALAVDQTRPDTLFAVDRLKYRSLLYKSTDGAATWSSLGRGGARSVLVAGTSPSRVYVGLDHEVMSSADGGKSWKESILYFSPGSFDELSIISLAAGRSDSSTVYAGSDMDYPHESIFESNNAGDSWAQRSDGLPQQQSVYSLAVDPTNPAMVLAASSAGLWRTTNGGSSWTLALQTPTRAVVLHPTDPSIVYAGTLGQGVQVSRDGGAHWSAFNEGGPNRFVLSLAIEATGRRLYAGTRSGVYGYDFDEESAATPVDLAVAPTGNTDFVAATASGHIVLGSVDSAGKTARQQAYGPYPGWSPIAFSGGLDGLTRVLWKNEDGRSDVWLAGPDESRARSSLRPRPTSTSWMSPALRMARLASFRAGTAERLYGPSTPSASPSPLFRSAPTRDGPPRRSRRASTDLRGFSGTTTTDAPESRSLRLRPSSRPCASRPKMVGLRWTWESAATAAPACFEPGRTSRSPFGSSMTRERSWRGAQLTPVLPG